MTARRYRIQSRGRPGVVTVTPDGPWVAAVDYDAARTQIGDMSRALFALQAENRALRERIASTGPCECCGAPLVNVEFGRATCRQGCSYPAETT